MPDYSEDTKKGKKGDVLERARKCFKLASEAEADQRKREKDDLRFQVPEEQWDETAKRQRMGTSAEGVPIPARPILSISKLDQPLQLVLNQARAARLGVNIHPVSEKANKEGAEIREGLYRRIERDSNADMARLWALDRASKAGRGVYRVTTKWDEDAPPESFDQEIVIERILHQESVYFDPSAKEPDFSDGEWAFVAEWMSFERFKRLYPKSKTAKLNTGEKMDWVDMDSEAPDWVRVEGDERAVRVAEYWYKEHDFETVEIGKDKAKRIRQRDIVHVYRCIVTGTEILEESEWEGQYIPLIPVIGRELQPYDSKRRWVGMIGPVKDAQRLYNYAASSAVEIAALEPKAPWVMAEGQDDGYEDEWQQSNIRNLAKLRYKPVGFQGQPLPPPQRVQVDVSRLGPSMQLLSIGEQAIQATTQVHDPSLGRESPREKSGRAIIALQQQSDAATSHYLASLADISMRYEARVILDLLDKIYDRPGRITTILRGENDESEAVMFNAQYVKNQDGLPVPYDPMTMQGQKPLEYDLKKGKYAVSVTIGKSFQTRLQEGSSVMGEILQARPEFLQLVGDLFFSFQDFPGSDEIAKRFVKIIKKQSPGLLDEGDQTNAEQIQAQALALQEENQALKQQLQGAMQALETDQVKSQATVAKAQIDAESKANVASIQGQFKLLQEQIKQQGEAIRELEQQRHEKEINLQDKEAEVATAAIDLSFKGSSDQPIGQGERY